VLVEKISIRVVLKIMWKCNIAGLGGGCCGSLLSRRKLLRRRFLRRRLPILAMCTRRYLWPIITPHLLNRVCWTWTKVVLPLLRRLLTLVPWAVSALTFKGWWKSWRPARKVVHPHRLFARLRTPFAASSRQGSLPGGWKWKKKSVHFFGIQCPMSKISVKQKRKQSGSTLVVEKKISVNSESGRTAWKFSWHYSTEKALIIPWRLLLWAMPDDHSEENLGSVSLRIRL